MIKVICTVDEEWLAKLVQGFGLNNEDELVGAVKTELAYVIREQHSSRISNVEVIKENNNDKN
jgi:hypothetical protein